MLRICIAIIIAIILIVIVVVGNASSSRYENYLTGLWIGDPAFLEKAQLSDLQLFIAPVDNGCRQGYLIITDSNGEFISNQAIEICERSSIRRWWSALRSAFRTEKDTYKSCKVDIEYDAVAEGEEPPMPSTLKLSLSMIEGTLTLYDDEKVYAFMEKDLAASAAAVEAYST